LPDEIYKETGIKPHIGLLHNSNVLDKGKIINIDELALDYSILDEIDYKYPAANAYFAYTTRGCIRKCSFCAVPVIESKYIPYISIKKQVQQSKRKFGDKKDLLLLDNNVLASKKFDIIVDEIKKCGFAIDARLVNEYNMKKLAEINIRPLRIAFDDWKSRAVYENAVQCAVSAGIKHLSNYMLYNCEDEPVDLWNRLNLNIELCEKWRDKGVSIYSFPMKYHPIKDPEYFRNREFIGTHWNRKYIRAVQAVLNSTKGKIGRGKEFFKEAFGCNTEEFNKILLMPETFIIYRFKYKDNLTAEWWDKLQNLTKHEQESAYKIIFKNLFSDDIISSEPNKSVRDVLKYYQIPRPEK